MRINLEFPFNQDWTHGYFNSQTTGRKIVHLHDGTGQTKTVSYARYLVSVELERYLSNDEEVDHVDDNFGNDSLLNLQVLTPEQNRAKQGPLNRVDIVHGSLTAYRYCKCDVCRRGKSLWSKGDKIGYEMNLANVA